MDNNIFLRAAVRGEIVVPQTSTRTAPPVKTKGKGKAKPAAKPKGKRKYTETEDLMLLKAVESNGTDWRSIASYMKRHSEVFGKDGVQFYSNFEPKDKKLQERLRKRFAKLNADKKK